MNITYTESNGSVVSKEVSNYKVTYKKLVNGIVTKFSPEIIIYGDNLDIVRSRLSHTIIDFNLNLNEDYKIVKIERK